MSDLRYPIEFQTINFHNKENCSFVRCGITTLLQDINLPIEKDYEYTYLATIKPQLPSNDRLLKIDFRYCKATHTSEEYSAAEVIETKTFNNYADFRKIVCDFIGIETPQHG